ncbi:phosphate ABC transporter permease subunit PstC [Pseudonocardia kunmingensis]|uniref:Phosphate transport system permease protein n=1 Tax=Pseudonocardia kunmingensis TaxID=630975 RepID=A0A543DKR1_9PSEU|nr:phosphate ABC transporter permease subunit PstC [Pseudonocardia kunmingensis]TQM09912.1 phosphate ABC transporter membrane protein 1 (PhoT family) [Pseudonocardia kunmingensis]
MVVSTAPAASPGSGPGRPVGALTKSSARVGERVIEGLLAAAGGLSVVVTIGIVLALVVPLFTFFAHVSPIEFLTGTTWTASFGDKFSWDKDWGVLPLVSATFTATAIALLVAVPLGLGIAMFLAEYASQRARKVVKPVLELLAGIPTVVYGFLALTAITPVLQPLLGIPNIFSILTAGLVMGFMIVPTVASLSEDAMTAVPLSLRQGSYALGANNRITTLRVVFPAALSGIIAAIVLGLSRAVGETMILAVAGGNIAQLTGDPRDQAQTMTAFIAQIASGDAPQGSPVYYSLFAVGALLFAITLIINLISIRLVRRFRQAY